MKKYLITVAFTVAVSGALVSCHDDQITSSTVEQKVQAFEDLFVQAFGKPDPNHTWGFGSPVGEGDDLTRSVDVNGNLWATRPSVTDAEAEAVYNYVNKPKNQIAKYYTISPVNLKNFFVTQVWGSVDNSEDENCHYTNLDNKAVFGPEHMDHLQISRSADRLGNGVTALNVTNNNVGGDAINEDWDHANNFNAARNRDWSGNTMFVNWGTQNFAYHSSEDNKYHDKWIIIDGADIRDANGNNYPGNYYVCFDFEATNDDVVTKIKVSWTETKKNPDGTTQTDNKSENVDLKGSYTIASAIEKGKTVTINGQEIAVGAEGYTWEVVQYVQGNKVVLPNEFYTDWIIRLTEAQFKEGVIPGVKISSGGTEVIGKVKRKIITAETVVQAGRVFCEDIVSARYSFQDLDYNDVVFDAAIVHKYRKLVSTYYDNEDHLIVFENGDPNPKEEYDFTDIDGEENGYSNYYAKVCVLAAGGTLPINFQIQDHKTKKAIFNDEIHNILGGQNTTVMINTLLPTERERVSMAEVALKPAKMLERRATAAQALSDEEKVRFDGVRSIDEDIILDVQYGNLAAGIRSKYYNGASGEVVATAKFMVPLGTYWAKERINIADAYSKEKFDGWVKNELETSCDWWNYPTSNGNLFMDNEQKELEGLDPNVWSKGLFLSAPDSTTTLEDIPLTGGSETVIQTVEATSTAFAIPSGETILYDFTAEGGPGPGFLYDGGNNVTISQSTTGFSSIAEGSTIRIYGVSIANWKINTTLNPTDAINASNYTGYATSGYIDIPVTDISNLNRNDFVIWGENFTVTFVTLVGNNSDSGNGDSGNGDNGNSGSVSTIWDQETVFNSWNSTIVIQNQFSNAKVGDIIRVNVKNKGSDYNPRYKHVGNWEDWDGFQNNITYTDGYFEAPIPNGALEELKSSGLRFQGLGFTITSVELRPI